MAQTAPSRNSLLQTILVVLLGQVGCITLIVVVGSILAGLWLDDTFGTRPLFTLILLFAGIPLSVILMLTVARRTLARLRAQSDSGDGERTV
jgi:F0F1-type ATP synthase assembly protein I